MKRFLPEKIHRILFKISGEILAGENGFGIDMNAVNFISEELISVKEAGYRIGIVLGGGNFFRGSSEIGKTINRVTADNIGMMATVQNALILSEVLNNKNYHTEVFSSVQMDKITKFYTPSRAITSMREGKICFFCGGTGNPFFTTDTAAVLRAIELESNIVMKGTKVDGVYSADPKKNKNSEFFDDISFDDVLSKRLNVMDMTAFSLAREYNMPIKIFNVLEKGNLKKAVQNKHIGTFVHS